MFDELDAELLAALGSDAVYTVNGGASKAIKTLITKDVDEFSGGFSSNRQNVASIADRSISPEQGDTLKVGAAVYTVSAVISDDGYLMKVLVV